MYGRAISASLVEGIMANISMGTKFEFGPLVKEMMLFKGITYLATPFFGGVELFVQFR